MSGDTDRDYPRNELDARIVRDAIKGDIQTRVGLSTLPWNEVQQILREVEKEITREAKMHKTFDKYWCSI